jgi:hypothetical protein
MNRRETIGCERLTEVAMIRPSSNSGPFWRRSSVLLSVPLLLISSLSVTAAELDLTQYERSVYSQFGEDGVVQKIFEIIDPTHQYAVEFGASDGVENNNMRRLVLEEGWGGLQIEGDRAQARALARNYAEHPRVKTMQAWIYPGNIEILFEEAKVPKNFDYLVIDIDSNDYYVWRAIRDYRPKVVQIEYNSAFPPPELAVVEFHPMNYWDGTDYHGASIQSYYELGKKKGYELIYGNTAGNNLIFVDAQYYPLFGLEDNSPERFYRPPAFGVKAGGRAPNGRGLPRFESRPVLQWRNLKIKKKMVER